VIPPAPAVHAFLHRTARAEVARAATKARADQKKERERLAAEKKEAKKQEKAEEKKEKARKAAEKTKEKEERIQAETKAKEKKKGGGRSSNDDDDDDDFDDSEEDATKKKKRGDTCTIYSRIHIQALYICIYKQKDHIGDTYIAHFVSYTWTIYSRIRMHTYVLFSYNAVVSSLHISFPTTKESEIGETSPKTKPPLMMKKQNQRAEVDNLYLCPFRHAYTHVLIHIEACIHPVLIPFILSCVFKLSYPNHKGKRGRRERGRRAKSEDEASADDEDEKPKRRGRKRATSPSQSGSDDMSEDADDPDADDSQEEDRFARDSPKVHMTMLHVRY